MILQYASVGINGVLTGLLYALMSVGLSVVFGVMKVVNFAHGEFLILASLLAVTLYSFLIPNLVLTLIIVTGVMAILGYFFQSLIIKRLLTYTENSQFISLIAVGIVLLSLQQMFFGTEAHFLITDYNLSTLNIGGLFIDSTRLITGIISLITSFCLMGFFHYTLLGKSIRACADNNLGAKIIGLDISKLYKISFSIACGCIGIAGTFLGMLVDITPQVAPHYTLLSFIIVIIGGLGSMGGALLGGVIIGTMEAYASFFFNGSLKTIFSFILLGLILIVRPQGLIGKK